MLFGGATRFAPPNYRDFARRELTITASIKKLVLVCILSIGMPGPGAVGAATGSVHDPAKNEDQNSADGLRKGRILCIGQVLYS